MLAKLEEIDLENLDLPQFGKLPFQQCWCEFPGHEGNAFGVLYADDTNQRGAIRLYRLCKTELCWFGPFSIRFDFTDNPNADKIADRFAFVAEDNAADDDLKAFYTEIMQDGLLYHLVAFTVLNFRKQSRRDHEGKSGRIQSSAALSGPEETDPAGIPYCPHQHCRARRNGSACAVSNRT